MDPKDNKVRYEGSQYLTTPETPVGLSTKYFYSPFPESLSNCKSIKLGLVREGDTFMNTSWLAPRPSLERPYIKTM